MNLPNKITLSRIFLTLFIIIILIFPFEATGIAIPKLFVNESIVIDIKYIVAGILFIIASLTDFLDGYLARKLDIVTDFGKMLDFRDTVVDSIKMIAGNKGAVVGAINTGKWKTACMMLGITLTLFYNLPFELWNFQISDILLIIACVLSVISGVQYYKMNQEYIMESGK